MHWTEHDRVTVQGDAGKLKISRSFTVLLNQGAALMFYPEVNVIFKARTDIRSGTPAYKRVPIVVYQ
jgi:hypothetical protein